MRRALLALLVLALPLVAVPAQADDVRGGTGPGLDTMERRELRMELSQLDGSERSRVAATLARPQTERQQCFTNVCVHWFTSGRNRATAAYVEQVAETSEQVLATYAAAGYRAPKPDGTRGGNSKLDIYLEDLGSQGLYGYCDVDSGPGAGGPWDVPAYCSFDNDYLEFTQHSPLENLQVTAAHELFHAVQFAYDYYEDVWFMESTATWAEDEVFDDVNDNVQYLRTSPLKQPGVPLDKDAGLRVYGGWIFFRYLTERFPDEEGGLPVLVREMWERADGSAAGPDDYSMEAVRHTLGARGSGLRATWARFAAANRQPGRSYEEGRTYPQAPLSGTVALSAARRSTGPITRVIDHLGAATVRITRAPGMAGRNLRLVLDLPRPARGAGAVATVHPTTGGSTTIALTPSIKADGTAVVKVPFDRSVARVEVTLANGSARYRRCGTGTTWSCQGRPADDGLAFRIRGRAVR